jgi:YidC/Oxa1 family membrane protein insertase
MRIMPLMFFVFAVNVPLALIIYWVTTNFWSVGQQYMLLRTAPAPAGGAAAEAAPAPALVEEKGGGGRRGLGGLSLFRGSAQSRAKASGREEGSRNGDRPARAGDGKEPNRPTGSGSKGGQAKAPGQGGRQGGGRQGAGGSRKSGSRSGKGKASGPRRGKR